MRNELTRVEQFKSKHRGVGEKGMEKKLHVLIAVSIVVILVIGLGVYYVSNTYMSSTPLPKAEPKILSYTGQGRLVYVTVFNDGVDGWVKVSVSATTLTLDTRMVSTQTAFLKKGESTTLQFVFPHLFRDCSASAAPVEEGEPPKYYEEPIQWTTAKFSVWRPGEWFGYPLQRVNKENCTFIMIFYNFTYEGTMENGSKVYLLWINLTNTENRTTFGSPLPHFSLVTRTYKTFGSSEILVPFFKPLESRNALVMFLVPEEEEPLSINWFDPFGQATNSMYLVWPP